MPITSKTDRSINLTTFVVMGEISADEAISALKPFYENPDHPPTLNLVWDLREILPVPSITEEGLSRIISYLSIHASKRRGGKTAIVARADFEFNVSKKYELFAQLKGLSIMIKVF